MLAAMSVVASGLIILVAILHVWFLILEMFLWQTPRGLKTFGNSAEKAKLTAILAANQGLYNGFLAAGLLISFVFSELAITFVFQLFFLTCVIVAGLYGAWTVNRRILFIQAGPAALALILLLFSRSN